MNNQAVIAKITAIRKHSNADKLQIATVLGHDVVVGLDYNVGEIGIYFPEGVQLSIEYCNANSLVRYTDPVTGEKKGGFFEESRRVRAQKFRGEKSDGYFARLSSLQELGIDIQENQLGLEFDVLNGIPICCKYVSPATQRAIKIREDQEARQNKPKRLLPSFLKHRETGHFRKESHKIVPGSLVIVTEKLHGTSARFGNVWVEEDYYRVSPWYKKLLKKLGVLSLVKSGFQFVNGTRNTILGKTDKAYYDCEGFRETIVAGVKDRLYEGETFYGEIVGFTNTGKSIMPSHPTTKLKDKQLEAQYGKEMHYKYGCIADDPNQRTRLYIYRITRVDSKGNAVEYSWPQVKARCLELGLDYVPEIRSSLVHGESDGYKDALSNLIESDAEGPSLLDSTHIREGVVLRVEPPIGVPFFLKEKSYNFKVMEGIVKDDDSIVDMEEAS